MIIPRREFLKLMGLATGVTGMAGCDHLWGVPDRLVDLALRGPGLEGWTQTVCGLCEGTCGITVRLVDGVPVGLKGNPQHPLNRGGLCPVGQGGLDVLYAPNRIQGPLQRTGEGRHQATTWTGALTAIAQRIDSLRSTGSAARIAFLNGEPGQLQDELLRYFMAVVGSPNYARPVDPAALAYRLTQGLERPPGLDLQRSDLVLAFGLDLFEDGPAPLHAISAMIGSRRDGEKADLIHVGTRLSPSAAKARLRARIRPGTHGAFALGVAEVLVREGRCDAQFIAEHTLGFEDPSDASGWRRMGFRRLLVQQYYPDRVAQICGCEATKVVEVARLLGEAESPVALAGGEAVEESNGTWNVMAVHALNALLGTFNRPGGVTLPPELPLTPMPAPPGGRTFAPGGWLFDDPAEGRIGTLDPLEALATRVSEDPEAVEVLFVLGWNPVFESPAGRAFQEALAAIPMVVSFSTFLDETAGLADFVLPASTFLEAWQCATTPASVPYGTIGVGKPVLDPLFDTRHPGDVALELGRMLDGLSTAFEAWPTYEDYIRHRMEGLAVAGQGSVFRGSLEASWVKFLEERGWRFMEQTEFGALWTELVNHGGWWNPGVATAAWSQMFPTPSGRFEFWSTALEQGLREIGSAEPESGAVAGEAPSQRLVSESVSGEEETACFPHHEPPLTVGEGEVRLMTFRPITSRGGLGVSSAMLLEMFGHTQLSGWGTWGEISPDTAHEFGLGHGDIVEFESEAGRGAVTVHIQPGGTPGLIHLPRGLGHSGDIGPSGGVGSNPLALIPILRDPLSGALALNGARGRLRLLQRRPHGAPAPGHGAGAP